MGLLEWWKRRRADRKVVEKAETAVHTSRQVKPIARDARQAKAEADRAKSELEEARDAANSISGWRPIKHWLANRRVRKAHKQVEEAVCHSDAASEVAAEAKAVEHEVWDDARKAYRSARRAVMRLQATDFYTYFRPEVCDLRVYLNSRGVKEAPPSPYEEVIRRLGERHEKVHLASFPEVCDLSSVPIDQRVARTQDAIRRKSRVIYQAGFSAIAVLQGKNCEIRGEPDFLILDGNGRYSIRDSKISRRITEEHHPEILRQLSLYGWLYERTTCERPASLQVHSGTGEIVTLGYGGGEDALTLLDHILAVRQAGSEPYSPVGWSKCDACGYKGICWKQAEERRDVAMLVGVDKGLVTALREVGVNTIEELLDAFDERRLARFERPWGAGSQRVGAKAGAIIRMAQAMASGKEILIQPPDFPRHPNYVMFDLEGLPPQLDELGKIYLWGMQVFGQQPGEHIVATAGFRTDGDRQGWNDFLANAEKVFNKYGDIPFVHWASYEKTHVKGYIERFGDRKGIAARVLDNLLDLLPITRESIALPLPSYSLKVAEQYVGFKRTQDAYGGDWAMAKYIEATETEDRRHRDEVMEEIRKYNSEDLKATWTVLRWLESKLDE